jgi:hypothetical protein
LEDVNDNAPVIQKGGSTLATLSEDVAQVINTHVAYGYQHFELGIYADIFHFFYSGL